jgi:hypothetical protein
MINKKINLIISTLVVLILNIQTAYTADNDTKHNPGTLKVTMRKVELCTSYQGGNFDNILTEAFCNNPITIGSGDKVVDIASVNAGESAASYGNPDLLLPLGETFTHMRVTIDKKFTLKSIGEVTTGSASGNTDACITKNVTDAMYGTGVTEASGKYTHRVAIDEDSGGTPQEMDIYWTNGKAPDESGNTFTHLYGNTGGASANTWFWTYNDRQSQLEVDGKLMDNTHIAMSVPRATVATDDLVLVYKLDEPYTVSMDTPSIDIAFSTKDGLRVYEASESQGSGTANNNDGKCAFTIGDVFVKISIAEDDRVKGAWQ